MELYDAIYFWAQMAWRLPVAFVLFVIDTIGLPVVLVILTATFLWLAYRYVMEVRK